MSTIPVSQAAGIFTQSLLDVYKEVTRPTALLRSFFPSDETGSKFISTEVQRGSEKVAADVLRGTAGNRNTFGRSTQKIYLPPYFREFFDATDLDFYDRLIGDAGGSVDDKTFAEWVNEVAEKIQLLQDKIERAQEVQCAQVLQTGIVTMVNGDNIDFKRKAASIVDVNVAGDYWSVTASATPIADLLAGCNFLRNTGKATGGTFNLLMGGDAYNALLKTDEIKTRGDIRSFDLQAISGPQRNAQGGALHGEISVGSYKLRIWTYPQAREVSGTMTPYIDENKAIIIPLIPRFKMGFAAVPHIMRDKSRAEFPEFIMNQRGAFHIGNYVDHISEAHVFDIKSASLPVPVAVDQIYTLQVLA